jgi:Glycosyl hydrolase family 115/Gylcosyl hydrolase family 115 C-terminal domain
MKKKLICFLWISAITISKLYAQDFITTRQGSGAFPVATISGATTIYTDSSDYFVVNKSASLLQHDIKMVTGQQPALVHTLPSAEKNMIVIGSIDSSAVIQQLVKEKKLSIARLKGKWEAYELRVIHQPFKGVNNALIIVGSDRRGTAYGVFTLSKQMGVSPWYWWADVPVKKKNEVYVKQGTYYYGPPAVKYRGIFLNDEAPSLSGWVHEKYGGFNHLFYDKVFELMLRLRANYLWPAMWGSAFNNDDTLNPIMANKYAIVMGTSHQEPMNQATEEWRRGHYGAWNYQTNDSTLRAFWKQGIENMDHRETIVTIGMRGNGDKPMTEGSNIALLERIIHDQRKIIAEVTGKPASETPQDWALYKEVQDYYDKGMRVPSDVTLLFSDDNWGNIRRLPLLKDSLRPGGFGMYYHFDYVGTPRNYKWLNTNQIERVWEQMHLAYEYHVRQIWIVNVGDLKPMEFPISFFMDYAWDPHQWPARKLPDYTIQWAREQFGDTYADEIANILNKYTKYNSRRKPELLSPDTYSLDDYNEAARVKDAYDKLEKESDSIYHALPENYRPAFYQLVQYPVAACANLNDLYITVERNRLYASQGRALTNDLADSARMMFKKDSLLSYYYNKVMENGKWDHMMDQTHIGYTYWQQPFKNAMPKVDEIHLNDISSMGVAIEGSNDWWPEARESAILPAFNPYQQQQYYIDIFNRGLIPFDYQVSVAQPWIKISQSGGQVEKQQRVWLSVNWQQAPHGKNIIPITITGPNRQTVTVQAVIHNPAYPERDKVHGFVEGNGYVSMQAQHYTKAINSKLIHWEVIPNLGRTGSAVTAFPITAPPQKPGGKDAHLEYRMYLFDTGTVTVQTYLSPTLDFHKTGGLRYAISFDNERPQIINMNADNSQKAWAQSVSDNIKIMMSTHHIKKAGWHVLKFWMVDPAVDLQKLVINLEGIKSSYLGAPESYYHP